MKRLCLSLVTAALFSQSKPAATLLYYQRNEPADPWIQPFIQRGWNAVKVPAPGACALAWVRKNAAKHNIDTTRLVAMTIPEPSPAPAPAAPCPAPEGIKLAAIVNWYSRPAPGQDAVPVITIHGDQDPVVSYPAAVQFHDNLDRNKISNELVTVKGGKHGNFGAKVTQDAYKSIFEFLNELGLTANQ